MSYTPVCKISDIHLNAGVCVLFGDEQISIFRVSENGVDNLYGVSNLDPFSKANVISRGLVGSIKGATVVASPIFKQHFRLDSGVCLQDESVALKTWKVFLEGEDVLIESKNFTAYA